MSNNYINKLKELLKSKDEGYIKKKFKELFKLIEDPFIVELHNSTLDEVKSTRTLKELRKSIDFLSDDIDNYIENVTNSKDFSKKAIRNLTEDIRDSIHSNNIKEDLDDITYKIDEVSTYVHHKMINIFAEAKDYNDDELSNLLSEVVEEFEERYGFKLKPLFDKTTRNEVYEYIEKLRDIRKEKDINSIKKLILMADIPEVEINTDKYIDKIFKNNQINDMKLNITKLIRELATYYELDLEKSTSQNLKTKKILFKDFINKPEKKKKKKKLEKIVNREDLLYYKDSSENKEINKILKIFHNIAKPHIDDSKLPVNISEKEISILSAIIQKLGKKSLEDINIKWNPMVGLFIESKEGFEKENQKLIMSHSDLVGTFQKMHQDVKDGKRKSAIQLGDDGLLSGSLDNTMTNAIVLNNYLEGRLEDNVSILFDRGEETGMWGAQNFHDGKHDDKWVQIELDTDSMKLSSMSTTAPITQKDCIVINTDVTMGYKEPYAFEVRDFDKETKKGIKNAFIKGAMSNYNHDDSADTVAKINPTMSFCFTVGSNKTKLKSGEYKFSGGCHSEFTFTTKFNIESYSEIFSEFVRAYGKEIKIELEVSTPKKFNNVTINNSTCITSSNVDNYKDLNYKENLEEYYNKPLSQTDELESITFEDKYKMGILLVKGAIEDEIPELEELYESNLSDLDIKEKLEIDEDGIQKILNYMIDFIPRMNIHQFLMAESIHDFANQIANNMSDQDYEDNYYEVYGEKIMENYIEV